MKRTTAALAVLLAAASLTTACTSGGDEEPELTWPAQIANPDAFAFRVVVGMTDGTPREGTPTSGTAATLDEVWEKVGDQAADAARELTAPPAAGGDVTGLAPFGSLTPAEVELLPPDVAFNVPYVHCGQLAELPREFPDPAAETVMCDNANAKYRLRPVAINATGLKGAKVDGDEVSGGYKVVLNFTDAGAQTWTELTAANVNNQVAIVLGDEVITAPTIMQTISGGTTEVTGNFSREEAKELVSRINDALTN